MMLERGVDIDARNYVGCTTLASSSYPALIIRSSNWKRHFCVLHDAEM
jgi:hypothetical protein